MDGEQNWEQVARIPLIVMLMDVPTRVPTVAM